MRAVDGVIEVLRARGVGAVFGNPGSSELPFLNELPADLPYLLCLQESIAIAAATGHAMATGEVAFVNLHGQPGVGHAIGALSGAARAGAPLVIVAGLPDSRHLADDPHLGGPVVDVVRPLVKWATQVSRADDLPRAVERAFRVATAGPRGPALVAVPMDLWEGTATPAVVLRAEPLPPSRRAVPEWLASALGAASAPALVVGAAPDGRALEPLAVRAAEQHGLAVYGSPLAGSVAFPTDHPAFRGHLGLSRATIRAELADHDLVLLIADRPPTVYVHSEGPMFPPGCEVVLVSATAAAVEGSEATRCIVAHPSEVLEALTDLPPAPAGRPGTAVPPAAPSGPWDDVFAALARSIPRDAIVVDEAMTLAPALRRAVPSAGARTSIRTPGGALGFGVGAAIGAQVARPDATVVAVVGDGALMYAPQALWTAARYDLPVRTVVVDNGGYASLRSFARAVGMTLSGTVDLALDGIDRSALARALGVPAADVTDPGDLPDALAELMARPGPGLLRVSVG